MKKVYIKNHIAGAGKWIYKGYEAAWSKLGYDVALYDNLEDIDTSKPYYVMALDGNVNQRNVQYIEKAEKCFLYVQPNTFPDPWGRHPNFSCLCDDKTISDLNSMSNVYNWCFGKVTEYHSKWQDVSYIPLAFDSINYSIDYNKDYEFDVCFIGGWANNGFDEKRQILIDHFKRFKQSGLKCGIFINRSISHEMETKILSSSKISLNLHDAYQRKLGLDTNERTFKSLGLCGYMISDSVTELENLFPDIATSSNPDEYVQIAQKALNLELQDLNAIKEQNRLDIINNHTYINRVEQLIEL